MQDDDMEPEVLSSGTPDPDEHDSKPHGYRHSRDACSSEICISCPQARSLVFLPSRLLSGRTAKLKKL